MRNKVILKLKRCLKKFVDNVVKAETEKLFKLLMKEKKKETTEKEY